MKLLDMVLADCDVETQSVIKTYYKGEFNVLLLESIGEICKEPFLNSFIAIIDYSFLENKGLEALEILKSIRPSLPVIFTASHFTEELFMNAFRLGAQYCFSKPLNLKEVDKGIELIFSYEKKGTGLSKNVFLPRHSSILNGNKRKNQIPPNIRRVKKHIEQNFSKAQPLDLLASIACMSRYHFCRTFKHCTGLSTVEYLNMIRIKEAKRFLRNNWFTISEICFFIGYNNLCQFERVFKKSEGVSPSVYRKRSHKRDLLKE